MTQQAAFDFHPSPVVPERTRTNLPTSEPMGLLLGKWRLWALRRGIELEGSQGERGMPVYTKTLDANLFEPLSTEAEREFQQADGQELRTSKCRALHSSSMAFVNATHHLRRVGRLDLMAQALKVQSVNIYGFRYERKLPISGEFTTCPNIDGFLSYRSGPLACTAIEAKLTEPLGRAHSGFPPKYFGVPRVWDGIPRLRHLAEQITGDIDPSFQCLHVKQLLCHVLGLKVAFGLGRFRLVLLYLDLPGECGTELRKEIADFARYADADLGPHTFSAVSYQQFILRLAEQRDQYPDFIDYLASRYL